MFKRNCPGYFGGLLGLLDPLRPSNIIVTCEDTEVTATWSRWVLGPFGLHLGQYRVGTCTSVPILVLLKTFLGRTGQCFWSHLHRVLKWWRHKNKISEIMRFVRIFWKNNVQEAHLPKMSISGQLVSEIVAQLCLENSIQTLLIFFLGRLSFLLTSHRRDEAHHSSTTRLPLSNSKLDHIVSNLLFIPAWWNCRCTRKQSVTGGTKLAQAGILWVPIACTAPHSSGPLSSSRNSFWSSVLSRRHISLSSKLIADPTIERTLCVLVKRKEG